MSGPDEVTVAGVRMPADDPRAVAADAARRARGEYPLDWRTLGGVAERYRFHPEGAAFGVALGEGPAGLPYWRDLRPDPARPLAQWEPAADWCPYAPDESAAELAQELMRVAGLVRELGVQPMAFLAEMARERHEPPPDPQARALGAALGALDEALGRGEKP